MTTPFRAGQILRADDLNAIATQLDSRIGHQVLDTDQEFVTFPDIPQDFTHLELVVAAQNNTTTNGNIRNMYIRFNGDNSLSYTQLRIAWPGDGTRDDNHNHDANRLAVGRVGQLWWSPNMVVVPRYSEAGFPKSALGWGTGLSNVANAANIEQYQAGGRYNNQDPITEVELSLFTDFFAAGSAFTLYGKR